MPNKTQDNLMDTSTTNDVTRSLDQLCAQMSFSHVSVPRVDAYRDIFEFINEFETVSATLSDEQQLKLLIKAFPPGRLRIWYDEKLKPIISSGTTWSNVKNKIIERYSDSEDSERYFAKLHDLRFKENTDAKLYDFVEELLFVFSKAFSKVTDDDMKIKYVKSILPAKVVNFLSQNDDYVKPRDLSTFLKAIRRYDKSRITDSCSSSDADRLKTSDLVSLIKDLVKQETDKKVKLVAAMQSGPRESSLDRTQERGRNSSRWTPNESSNRQDLQTYRENRPYSPSNNYRHGNRSPRERSVDRKFNYDYQNGSNTPSGRTNYDRSRQGNYSGNRSTRSGSPYPYRSRTSPSPNWRDKSSNQLQSYRDTTHQSRGSGYRPGGSPTQQRAFSDSHYYSKHKMPPSPCPNCQCMHWARHCPDNLN